MKNDGGQKDSLANILETGEFGVNIVGMAQAEQMVIGGMSQVTQMVDCRPDQKNC